MNKKLLLTGIGGSIGCHFFAHIMHNTNWDVVGIDSFRHKGLTDRVNEILKTHPSWKKRLTIITHDLNAPFSELIKKQIGKLDYIISMASISDVYESILYPVPFIQNNVALVVNLLEFAREVKPEVFLQFSTDEVYGPTSSKEQKYKEWDALIPSNPYSASKACQEMICISYWRTYNIPIVITNTMNNFGEMQQSNKFPVIVQKAIMEDKEFEIHGEESDMGSRSYIHSRNCSDAVLFILKIKPYLHANGKVDRPDRYNIAGDKQIDNLELPKLIAKLMRKKFKYRFVSAEKDRPGHDKHYGLDDTKLKNLGWKSSLSFEKSLKKTIQWQIEHKEWI